MNFWNAIYFVFKVNGKKKLESKGISHSLQFHSKNVNPVAPKVLRCVFHMCVIQETRNLNYLSQVTSMPERELACPMVS